MKKIIYVIPLLPFTVEDLISGTWVATAGHEGGESEGDLYSRDFMMKGLEFEAEGIVYSVYFDEEEYKYYLEKREGKIALVIDKNAGHYSYYIDKIDDYAIGLIGAPEYQKEESCYLERQD